MVCRKLLPSKKLRHSNLPTSMSFNFLIQKKEVLSLTISNFLNFVPWSETKALFDGHYANEVFSLHEKKVI